MILKSSIARSSSGQESILPLIPERNSLAEYSERYGSVGGSFLFSFVNCSTLEKSSTTLSRTHRSNSGGIEAGSLNIAILTFSRVLAVVNVMLISFNGLAGGLGMMSDREVSLAKFDQFHAC